MKSLIINLEKIEIEINNLEHPSLLLRRDIR